MRNMIVFFAKKDYFLNEDGRILNLFCLEFNTVAAGLGHLGEMEKGCECSAMGIHKPCSNTWRPPWRIFAGFIVPKRLKALFNDIS